MTKNNWDPFPDDDDDDDLGGGCHDEGCPFCGDGGLEDLYMGVDYGFQPSSGVAFVGTISEFNKFLTTSPLFGPPVVKRSAADMVMDLWRKIHHGPKDTLIIADALDATEIALFKLARKFGERSPSFQLRAMMEQWDTSRLVRELY